MGYTPADNTTGSTGSTGAYPWKDSEFYIDKTTSAVSATNNPFGGSNVLWSMDPESRREMRKSFGANADAYKQAYDANIKLAGLSGNVGVTKPIGPSGSGGPKTTRQTYKNVKEVNMETFMGFATNAFQTALGRNASDEEMTTFLKELNKAERANPTVSRVTTRSNNGNVTSTTSSSGGMDEQAFVQNKLATSGEGQAYSVGSVVSQALNVLARRLG